MPTEAEPFHLLVPEHPTAWRSHLRIAHCIVLRQGREIADADLEALHDELHARPLKGAIPHVHTPRPQPVDGHEDHGFW